ncbi:hypothetical protein MUN76_02790 [Leucobacter rhizosphaerae]|uniref:DUF11 domain-containing protein n=1 Tax=Leucobacter rhizosphaerae TaxID=2932245 RepID=A0ABY4FX93_9MICO|nr:hypothetical protein [Leucobacter rhizosphaerae]UOQ60921.1 hypothetical protein MUN76_02790 [Leucobacter rhizosphaerae]
MSRLSSVWTACAALLGALALILVASVPAGALDTGPRGGNTGVLSTSLVAKNATVFAGDALVYEANVSCSAPDQCLEVSLRFSPPPGATPGALGTVNTLGGSGAVTQHADGSVSVHFSSVPAGVTTQLVISWPTENYTTDPGPQPITMTVAQPGAPDETRDASIALVASSELTLAKTGPADTRPNEEYTYLLTYGLTSPDAAGNHGSLGYTEGTLVDPLPPEAEFVRASHGGTYDGGAHSVSWDLATISVSTTVTVTVRFPTVHDAPVTNTATLSGRQHGTTTTTSVSSSSPVVVADVAPFTNTSVRKLGTPLITDHEQTFRFEATNYGNTTMDLTISDPIPAGLNVTSVNRGYYEAAVGAGSTVEFFYADGSSSGPLDFVTAAVDVPPGHARVVRIDFSILDVPVGATVSPQLVSTGDWAALGDASTITNCGLVVSNGVDSTEACGTIQVSPVETPEPTISKSATQAPVAPGGTITWTLSLGNTSTATPWLPLLIDDIPNQLTYVDGSFTSSPANDDECPVAEDFEEERLDGFDAARATPFASGARDTSVRWTYRGSTGVPTASTSRTCDYHYDTTVNPGAPSGSYTGDSYRSDYRGNVVTAFDRDVRIPLGEANWIIDAGDGDGDGDVTELAPRAGASFTLDDTAAAWIEKHVSGDLDAGTWFASAEPRGHEENVATVRTGGTVSYRVTLGNLGNRDLRELVAYDLLPSPEAPGVTNGRYGQDPSGGANEWTPLMTGPIVSDAPSLVVSYSEETDPCRPEMDNSNARSAPFHCDGTLGDSWVSADQVADWSAIRSLRFDFGDRDFAGGEHEDIEWTMAAPGALADGDPVQGGERTWNRVAVSAVQNADGSDMLAAEAPWVVAQLRLGDDETTGPDPGTDASPGPQGDHGVSPDTGSLSGPDQHSTTLERTGAPSWGTILASALTVIALGAILMLWRRLRSAPRGRSLG